MSLLQRSLKLCDHGGGVDRHEHKMSCDAGVMHARGRGFGVEIEGQRRARVEVIGMRRVTKREACARWTGLTVGLLALLISEKLCCWWRSQALDVLKREA